MLRACLQRAFVRPVGHETRKASDGDRLSYVRSVTTTLRCVSLTPEPVKSETPGGQPCEEGPRVGAKGASPPSPSLGLYTSAQARSPTQPGVRLPGQRSRDGRGPARVPENRWPFTRPACQGGHGPAADANPPPRPPLRPPPTKRGTPARPTRAPARRLRTAAHSRRSLY